jgi:hypothetical protein
VPTINTRSVITTGLAATPLVGNQYEILPFPAMVEIGIVSNVNLVLATVYSGSDLLQQEGPVQLATVDFLPKYPDDYGLTDVADERDRLSILLRNTNAGTATVICSVKITPL